MNAVIIRTRPADFGHGSSHTSPALVIDHSYTSWSEQGAKLSEKLTRLAAHRPDVICNMTTGKDLTVLTVISERYLESVAESVRGAIDGSS